MCDLSGSMVSFEWLVGRHSWPDMSHLCFAWNIQATALGKFSGTILEDGFS